MTELRHDLVSGRPVIVAEARGARPHTLASGKPDEDRGPEGCPFCPGYEAMTPPEIARTGGGEPGEPGWRVRAFPNLYPIIDAHEVVVLSADHRRSFAQLSDDAAGEVFVVMRERVRALLDGGAAFATAIVNQGRAAGASIAHPHAQVFALDFVPPEVVARLDRQRASGDDLLGADIELARVQRLVVGDDDVVTWCPFGSTSPLLVRCCPSEAVTPRFEDASDAEVASVARATRDALARLGAVVADPPYNLVVHPAPRWHVEITPRLGVVAGFEQTTGVFVNTLPPERAVELLRETAP
jgi:UDPglucose--hexose-1-phosphate uridylyltransferase